jgi:hypothetical protein
MVENTAFMIKPPGFTDFFSCILYSSLSRFCNFYKENGAEYASSSFHLVSMEGLSLKLFKVE